MPTLLEIIAFLTEAVRSLSEETAQESINSIQVLETIGTALYKTLADKVSSRRVLKIGTLYIITIIVSWPGQSRGRAIVLPSASASGLALAAVSALAKGITLKFFM